MQAMDETDALRAFNRFWLGEMGLYAQSYLGSGIGMAEVRVLYDLAQEEGLTARVLARRLRLDEGQLSRMLKRFETQGLLSRLPHAGDARQRVLALTAAGQARLAPLQARSRADMAQRLSGLSPANRAAMVAAMQALRSALSPQAGAEPALQAPVMTDLQPGDAGSARRFSARGGSASGRLFARSFRRAAPRRVARRPARPAVRLTSASAKSPTRRVPAP